MTIFILKHANCVEMCVLKIPTYRFPREIQLLYALFDKKTYKDRHRMFN